jgi:NADH-quinone oxidoreductase subunit E
MTLPSTSPTPDTPREEPVSMSDNDGTETAIATATTRETGTPQLDPRLVVELRQIIGRYPEPRSALLPMLHLVQSVEGYVTPAGIETCAALLSISPAEVSAVATFYTMYKRRPMGEHLVGVCTNTLCAVLGGDEILTTLKEHLGVGNDETTDDGRITLEHIECNAACDYAPVLMVNWEFFDNQTPASAVQLVDALRSGAEVSATRGPRLCTWRQAERILAGFPDDRADEGPGAGPATLAGLRMAREHGWTAPEQGSPGAADRTAGAHDDATSSSGSTHLDSRTGPGRAEDEGAIATGKGQNPAGSPADSPSNAEGPTTGKGAQ